MLEPFPTLAGTRVLTGNVLAGNVPTSNGTRIGIARRARSVVCASVFPVEESPASADWSLRTCDGSVGWRVEQADNATALAKMAIETNERGDRVLTA